MTTLKRILGSVLLMAAGSYSLTAFSAVSVDPITWNVIGLDSNKPNQAQPNPGVYPPDTFPVGIRVCTDSELTAGWYTDFVWEDAGPNPYLYLTDSGHPTVDPSDPGATPPNYHGDLRQRIVADPLPANECRDIYYQVSVYRVPAAYNATSDYRIDVRDSGGDLLACTPSNDSPADNPLSIDCSAGLPPIPGADSTTDTGARELFVEYLVSQNRNAVDYYVYNGVTVSRISDAATPADATITVAVGQVFTLELHAHTATQGYEQLETYIKLPPDLFSVRRVSSTYSANAGTDPAAGRQMYADGCKWVNDPNSSRYHNNEACLSVGKYGGTVVNTYEIEVLAEPATDLNDGDPGLMTAQALIYDYSGSSYHYNSGYSNGLGGIYVDWGTAPEPTQGDVEISKVYEQVAGGNEQFVLTVTNNSAIDLTGIAVNDPIPSGYATECSNKQAPPSVGSITWPCANGNPVIGWTINWTGISLTAGSSATATIVVQRKTGERLNCASIVFDDDLDPSNNQSCASVPEDQVDLAISKVVERIDPVRSGLSDNTIEVGDTVEFTITVTNNGPQVALDVVVDDVFNPAAYSSVTETGRTAGTAYASGQWAIGTLSAGGSASITFSAVVEDAAAITDYRNEAVVSTSMADTDPTNNAAQAAIEPTYLTIDKTPDGASWELNAGTGVVGFSSGGNFTVSVNKSGNDTALNNVVVEDTLPTGLVLAATPSGSSVSVAECDSGSDWVCSGAAGDTAFRCVYEETETCLGAYPQIGVAVNFDTDVQTLPVSLSNFSFVRSATDPDDAAEAIKNYDEDTGSINVVEQGTPLADLELSKVLKTGSSATPNVGDEVTFTVSVTNQGLDDATGVEVQDLLPNGYTYVSNTASVGSYVDTTGVWTLGALANGDTETLDITVTVNAPGDGVVHKNVAEVTASDQDDPDSTPDNDTGSQPEDDEDSASVTPKTIDLSLSKSGSASSVPVGGEVTFTLTLSNAGPDTATGITVEDVLPANTTYVSSSIAGGDSRSEVSGTLTWTVSSLDSGSSVDLTFKATVDAATTVTNSAQVTTANEHDADSTPDNDVASEDDQDSFDVTAVAADLAVAKDDGVTTVRTNDEVVYTVVVTNNGPSVVTGAQLEDPAVTGLSKTAVACATTPGNCVSAPTVADLESGFTLPALANGDTYALEITATVDATSGEVTNTATVTAPSGVADPDPENDSDSDTDTVEVIYDPPYGIKTGTVEDGGTRIHWTMVWHNATGVPVSDVLITDDTSAYSGWDYLGSLTCAGNGTTVVNRCELNGDVVEVEADFGSDEFADTLEISFLAEVTNPVQRVYLNQATSSCTSCDGATDESDDNAKDEDDPTMVAITPPAEPVPVLPWPLLVLMAMMMVWASRRRLRKR